MPPRVTVITPSFNQGEFLEETIVSVLDQTYPNLQYIVVDGGSTDQSVEILDRYQSRIDHVIREPDLGQSDAICKGLELADGDLFNWINSDDRLEPGILNRLASINDRSIDLFAFDVTVEDADGCPPVGFESRMTNTNLSAKAMLRCDRYSFAQPGLWFRMDHLKACGGINRELNYGFDWDLIVRYLAKFPHVGYVHEPGAMFRLHERSKTMIESSKGDERENRFKQENDLIRDQLEFTLPKTLAAASMLGRRRGPWHDHLIKMLDEYDRSPAAKSFEIALATLSDPDARLSSRTLAAIARLMSRYVRPGFRTK